MNALILKLLEYFYPPLYIVEYFAIGMMSNEYKAGEYTFCPTKKEIKEHGSIPNVGFAKNYESLLRHCPLSADGYRKYIATTYKVNQFPLLLETYLLGSVMDE